jgi:GNAT superfamily N-acetyltransferase
VIAIVPVRTRRELRAFIRFPYTLHRNDPHWVPPLRVLEWTRFNRRLNPFFEHADMALLLALREGKVVGRIAAMDDRRHNELHKENIATFGCFEATDAESARSLLGSAEAWARNRGRSGIRGPLDLSLNESAGLLVEGFDEDPMILMPYNPPAYREYLEHFGYEKLKDLYAWILNRRDRLGEREQMLAKRVRQRLGVSIRTADLRHLDRDLTAMLSIYARAWEGNWGFVAPTEREARNLVAVLRHLVDPRGVLMAEIGGRAVAFLIAVPDLNQVFKGTDGRLFPYGLVRLLRRKRLVDQYRLPLLGVLPEHQQTGLYPLLMAELYERSHEIHWRRIEFSWVLEENLQINHAAAAGGAQRYKTYRIFEKQL